MSELAKYAYATLSLSAKLHRLLEGVGKAHGAAFEEELERTLRSLEKSHAPLAREARVERFLLLKEELERLAAWYEKEKKGLEPSVVARLDGLFARIREKIREKEFSLNS